MGVAISDTQQTFGERSRILEHIVSIRDEWPQQRYNFDTVETLYNRLVLNSACG